MYKSSYYEVNKIHGNKKEGLHLEKKMAFYYILTRINNNFIEIQQKTKQN